MEPRSLAALSFNWPVIIAVVGLVTALASAWATLRRLPGQRDLDKVQRDSMVVEMANTVAVNLRMDLEDCRELRKDMEQNLRDKDWEIEGLKRWCARLEAALRAAKIPIPTRE